VLAYKVYRIVGIWKDYMLFFLVGIQDKISDGRAYERWKEKASGKPHCLKLEIVS
jgi:hypothetical protein